MNRPPNRSAGRAGARGLLAALAVTALGGAPAGAGDAAALLNAVSRPAIEAHLAFLADDRLEGRATGERGFDVAALYAATRLREYGLAAGAGDSFLQAIEFQTTTLEEAELQLLAGEAVETLVWKEDFVASGGAAGVAAAVEAPLVFAGYGIEAPELGVDDYAGLDVRGKIVVVLSGAPARFPTDPRAHYSSRTLKAAVAARHGAVGQVTVRTRTDEKRLPWERMKHYAGRPSFDWLHPDGRVESDAPGLIARLTMSGEAFERLFAAAGSSLAAVLDSADTLEYPLREMAVRLRYRSRASIGTARSANVVAVLPGSDPELAGESIVCTAHLDHNGVGREVAGDSIYNGFYDNAVGSAIVLEMARLLASSPERPRRSVVFALVTGEERGLLGSEYFAAYPPTAAGDVVANVNVDMPIMIRPARHLVAYGAEHSTMGPVVDRAAARFGFTVVPDPTPEEVGFIRSDQYSFVRRGVPALCLETSAGPEGANPELAEAMATFGERHYHQPSDEAELGIDWESALRFTAVNAEVVRALADAPERPSWNPGDFFGDLFAAGER